MELTRKFGVLGTHSAPWMLAGLEMNLMEIARLGEGDASSLEIPARLPSKLSRSVTAFV
jgi:hypothetical protein